MLTHSGTAQGVSKTAGELRAGVAVLLEHIDTVTAAGRKLHATTLIPNACREASSLFVRRRAGKGLATAGLLVS